MQITEATRDVAAEWDAFVRHRRESTFCHLFGWRGVMEDVFGHATHYLAARDNGGNLAAVLPLVRVRSRMFGDHLVSMPFLSCGGPLGDPEAVSQLVQHARRLGRQTGVDLLELRSRNELPGDWAISRRKITVLLTLPGDPEELWNAFQAKVRSQIRRSMKEGMDTVIGPDQVGSFYHIFSRHMRDLGTPVLPRAAFVRALQTFPKKMVFATVYHESGPVAAGAGFVHGDEFEITWASALREYTHLAPNMLLYWSLMEEMSRRGLRTFNLGRCSPGSDTHRFNSQWGGRDVSLPWTQWSPAGRDDTPSPGSAGYQLATRVWQKLPLAVTNRLGPWLARNIP